MISMQRYAAGLLCAAVLGVQVGVWAAPRSKAKVSAKPSAKKATQKVARAKKAAVKKVAGPYVDGVAILSGSGEIALPAPRVDPLARVRRVSASLAPRMTVKSGFGGEVVPDNGYSTNSIAPLTTSPARQVGDKIFPPQFETMATDGQRINLTQYQGKVVLLDFWATWCPPSVQETPALLPLYQKHYANGFDIIGISLDGSRGKMDDFARAQGLPWRQIFGGRGWESSMAQLYEIEAIPETVLLDRDGSVLAIGLRGEMLNEAVAMAMAMAMAGQFK